jgi:transcriptional regulator with XRE-family HTH domain
VAFFDEEVATLDTSDEKWHILCNVNRNLHIMVRHCHGVAAYAPLYVHTFRLLQPHKLTEAERFNINCPDPARITNISDTLRYYRYRKALKQSDVADYIGIYRSTYIHYENGMATYPLDKLEMIAALFEIDITDLLDDYHFFLWQGQGKQLKTFRQENRLTQKDVAQHAKVAIGTVKRWESDKVVMSRTSWEKLFGEF